MKLKLTLQQARIIRKLSPKQLASRLGTDESAVKTWESGAEEVPTELIPSLCYALRFPAEAISLP